jgi:hypothetical protein
MRFLSILLCLLISLPLSPFAIAQTAVGKINLVVVEGEGAINNIRQRTARESIVQVEDENHRPKAGAAVVFTLPSQGAGGAFSGQQTLTVMSDSRGRAVARGFRPNKLEGRFEVRVNASYQGQTATATIVQSNVVSAVGAAAAAGISAKLITILAIGAAAAVTGGVVAATRGGSNGSTPTSVTAGTTTVGAPR